MSKSRPIKDAPKNRRILVWWGGEWVIAQWTQHRGFMAERGHDPVGFQPTLFQELPPDELELVNKSSRGPAPKCPRCGTTYLSRGSCPMKFPRPECFNEHAINDWILDMHGQNNR